MTASEPHRGVPRESPWSQEAWRREHLYLTALEETALAAIRRLDVTEMLRTIVTRAASLVETEHGYAYLRDEGGDEIEVKAGTGVFTHWMGYRMRIGEGMAGRILLTREPMVIDDYDRWKERSPGFPLGIMRAVMGVPLMSGDEVTGVIGLAHVEDGRTFTRDDVALLSRFAEIASVALDNARLHAAAQRELAERKEAEEQFAYLAFHDRLTGLPNGAMFEDVLQLALARATRQDLAVAVLYIDLDNFKLVNDNLGHAVGDELLREMASRLKWAVRQTDLVARQSGDEFLVLLADLDRRPASDGRPRAVHLAEDVASRIHDALKWPFVLAGTELTVSASIGISIHPVDAQDAHSLLRAADAAMYRSKNRTPGGTSLSGFAGGDPSPSRSLASRLRAAVKGEAWALRYQPVVDLSSGRVVGVEALVRWRDEAGQLVGPGSFVPLAEELGLIDAIEGWVLEELSEQQAGWREDGLDLEVSFNLSPRRLWRSDLAGTILPHLDRAGTEPGRVVVEITESAVMADAGRTRRVLRDLHDRGLRLAIDDFGTGYSSLSVLKTLPIDVLKIDRPLLRDVPSDAEGSGVIRAVIDLARSLDMEPLAEGVETEAQRQFLVDSGCALGQGFHFSEPVEPERIVAIARAGTVPAAPDPGTR